MADLENTTHPSKGVAAMPAHGRASGLLGREQEQAELGDALSAASRGEQQVVVVAGDAGVGKTTLVADLARRAEGLGFTVATGHGLDIGADISFAPVVEAVRTLLEGVDDTDARPVARRMRSTVLDPAAPRSAEQIDLLEDLRLTVLEARHRDRFCWCSRTCIGPTPRPGTSRWRSRGPHGVG
jgi:hypothetical protein